MILSKILNTSINLSSNLFFFFKFVSNLFLFSSLFWNALWIYGKQRQYRLTYISIHHMNISTCFSVTTCIWTRLNWMNLGLLVARLINPLIFKITDWIMFCKMYFFFFNNQTPRNTFSRTLSRTCSDCTLIFMILFD